MKTEHVALMAATFLFASGLNKASAYRHCHEPDLPDCVERGGGFSNGWDRDLCHNAVENFGNEVDAYTRCLARQQEEVREKAQEAMRQFNCRVQDRSYC